MWQKQDDTAKETLGVSRRTNIARLNVFLLAAFMAMCANLSSALAVIKIADRDAGIGYYGPLDYRLGEREVLSTIFPGADELGEISGAPPAAPVYQDGELVGKKIVTKPFCRD